MRFVAGVVPFAGADDDAHVIVFPRIGYVRQIFVGAVEVNVVVVITVEERADVERATQADEVAHRVGMTKSDICSVISAEAGATDRDAMTIAFAPCEIKDIADDHVFVRVVGAHPISRVNRFVVEAFQVDRVRAIDSDFACIDISAHRTDQPEVFVLIITAEGSGEENQRQPAAISEREHLELAT